jgi:hypothetical protein
MASEEPGAVHSMPLMMIEVGREMLVQSGEPLIAVRQ